MEFEQIPGGSGGQEPGGQWSIGLQRVQLILVTEKKQKLPYEHPSPTTFREISGPNLPS